MNIHDQQKLGRRKLSGSRCPINIVNWIVLTVENFQGLTTMQLLREIQKTMEKNKIQPQQFEDRIIFMSMKNDIDWETIEIKKLVFSNSSEVAARAKIFPKRHWSFLGPGMGRKVIQNGHPQAKRFVESRC